jgi:hypothetical protein
VPLSGAVLVAEAARVHAPYPLGGSVGSMSRVSMDCEFEPWEFVPVLYPVAVTNSPSNPFRLSCPLYQMYGFTAVMIGCK